LSALTSSNTRRSCANCFFDSFDFIDTSSPLLAVAVVELVVVVVVVFGALFDDLLDANRRDKRKSEIIVEFCCVLFLTFSFFAVSAKAFVSNAACGDQGQNAVGQLAAHLRSHDALASRDRWIAPPSSSSSSASSSAMLQLHAHAHAQRLVDEFQRERAAPAPQPQPAQWAAEFVRASSHSSAVHAVPWANEFHAAYAAQQQQQPERFDDFEQFEAWARLQQAPLHEPVRAIASEQDQVRDDLRRLARRYREPTAAAWAAEYARDVTPAKDAWAAEFAAAAAAPAPAAWIEEFRRTESQPTAEAWASEFARERTAAAATTTTTTTTQRELLDEFLGETAAASTADENFAQSAAAASSLERFAEYVFASPNPFLDAADPFGDGQRLFRSGSLADAVLALEAAVQRAPGGVASASAAPAWALLGQAHAENDHDGRAISCLMRAVDADNSDLNALIALGVSCANDYYRDEALNLLETWLDQHPDYRHVAAEMPAAPPFRTIGGGGGGADVSVQSFERHARVTAMFLRAANLKAGAAPDANVQTALGLLYNLSYEYDRAADCFRAALSVQPDNYSLWNKLGATLANGNDSRAALAAYHRALALKPQYVRARANLGIAHLALGEFNDAAHHLSLALKRHGAADDEHLWNNLELVCRLMENDTAAQRARARDVALLNQFS
jgi:peroxin-5